jgi:hypothetical protein
MILGNAFLARLRRAITLQQKRGLEVDPLELAKELIRQERQRLSRAGGYGRGSAAELLNRERYARRKAQELAASLLGRRRKRPPPKDLLVAQFRESPLLDAILPGRRDKWVSALSRDATVTSEIELDGFSFLDNPQRTLSAIKTLAQIGCTAVNARLHFNDPVCPDIGAYLVLGEIWPALSPYFSSGRMSPPVQKVMEAVGLRRLMQMRLKAVRNLEDIWAFPVRQRRPFGEHKSTQWMLEPQRDQHAADDLCDEINQWLGVPDPPHELTDEGRAWISTIVLELLNNAQRHSDPANDDGSWAVAAFMGRSVENGKDVFRCHLGILSVGASIAQSLDTCAPRTAAEIAQYVALHRRSGISPATLKTLYALQDGVTRDPDAEAKNRGGVGLQEVIALMNLLGGVSFPGQEPRLTIVSGTSCISLRTPYIMGERLHGPDSPRVLWFNPDNNVTNPPDNSHVFDLTEPFAGTIISMSFILDGSYLREKFNGRNQSR